MWSSCIGCGFCVRKKCLDVKSICKNLQEYMPCAYCTYSATPECIASLQRARQTVPSSALEFLNVIWSLTSPLRIYYARNQVYRYLGSFMKIDGKSKICSDVLTLGKLFKIRLQIVLLLQHLFICSRLLGSATFFSTPRWSILSVAADIAQWS